MKLIRRICSDFSVGGVVACLLLFAVSDDAPSAQKNQKIQIGYCAKLNEIDTAKSIGFDYIELRTSEVAALSAEEFEKLTEKLKRLELPSPVTYLFIPGSIKLTGPNIDKRRQMEYVTRALDRVSRLGARVITFGTARLVRSQKGFRNGKPSTSSLSSANASVRRPGRGSSPSPSSRSGGRNATSSTQLRKRSNWSLP